MPSGKSKQETANSALQVLFQKTGMESRRLNLKFFKKKALSRQDDKIPVDTKVLKSKVPLKFLSDRDLEALAELAAITKYKKGDVLFKTGDKDDMSVYLLSGSVVLEASDGRTTSIRHNHRASLYALANLKPRMYTARAGLDGAALLWIKSDVLDQYFSKHKLSNGLDMECYDVVSV